MPLPSLEGLSSGCPLSQHHRGKLPVGNRTCNAAADEGLNGGQLSTTQSEAGNDTYRGGNVRDPALAEVDQTKTFPHQL